MDLLTHLEYSETLPHAYFHTLINSMIRLIPEARGGIVGVSRANVLQVEALVGKPFSQFLDKQLPWAGRDEGISVERGDLIEILRANGVEPEESFVELCRSQRVEVLGSYGLGSGSSVVVFLALDQNKELSKHSEQLFRGFLTVTGRHQRLVAREAQLRDAYTQLEASHSSLVYSYREVEELSSKLKHILNLTANLGDSGLSLHGYLELLLDTALLVVGNAEAGSVSIVDSQKWTFVATRGHDLGLLQSLDLTPQHLLRTEDIVVVDNILEQSKQVMAPELFQGFKAATAPIRQSLIVNLPAGPDLLVNLTLDVLETTDAEFTPNATRIFGSFAKLAQGFVSLRVHTEAIKSAYKGFTERLAFLAEVHDSDTAAHNTRVAEIAAALGREMGLDEVFVEEIRLYGGLHDIGKLFVDKELIRSTGSLSEMERRKVQMHTELAGKLLRDDPMFRTAHNIALYHHERYDGSGYPHGLVGDSIPIEAQLIAVADVYDALRSERPYKAALPPHGVLERLTKGDDRNPLGSFNPAILSILEKIVPDIEARFYQSSP